MLSNYYMPWCIHYTIWSCVCVLVAQSCLIFHDSMDCNQSGSSVHGNFQARILEWVAIPFSRGWTHVSFVSPALEGRFFTTSTTGEAWNLFKHSLFLFPYIIFINLKSDTGRQCYSHFRDEERVLEVWSKSHRKSQPGAKTKPSTSTWALPTTTVPTMPWARKPGNSDVIKVLRCWEGLVAHSFVIKILVT